MARRNKMGSRSRGMFSHKGFNNRLHKTKESGRHKRQISRKDVGPNDEAAIASVMKRIDVLKIRIHQNPSDEVLRYELRQAELEWKDLGKELRNKLSNPSDDQSTSETQSNGSCSNKLKKKETRGKGVIQRQRRSRSIRTVSGGSPGQGKRG